MGENGRISMILRRIYLLLDFREKMPGCLLCNLLLFNLATNSSKFCNIGPSPVRDPLYRGSSERINYFHQKMNKRPDFFQNGPVMPPWIILVEIYVLCVFLQNIRRLPIF